MAYDEGLAERLRECFKGKRGITEKRMFGSNCFLIGGNLWNDDGQARMCRPRAAGRAEAHAAPDLS